MKNQSYICKFYDNFLSLHKTPKQNEEYFIVSIECLKCIQCFFRMLTVIRIMLTCSLFVRINMLRWYLRFVQIQTNTEEDVCLRTWKKVRITKKQLLQGVSNNREKQLFQGVLNKSCSSKQIYRRQPRRRAISIMLLHSLIEIALLHGGLL